MKKLFSLLAISGMLFFGSADLFAQEEATSQAPATENVQSGSQAQPEEVPIHKAIKTKFIEGGAGFMASVLICLILGLAIAIERIIYLGLSSTNNKKLLQKVEDALNEGGIEAAKEVCKNTRGPVASIFYQGLDRYDDKKENNIDLIEKSVVSYGSVQMGQMESGVTWINLFIALSPMLGFMGTVIGMIQAFDSIEQAGDVSASLVAAGIKVALITTVTGLVAAIILQVFCNYILSKIESITNDMEDASISFIDILVKYQEKNN
ncbi:MAG: MotA/TolQ/ExbB proton channel family protein [Bacteroidales bacterium]|jgi:biopolymer transport protein ExbB|nr:MotA/TolQ/ExbB proton channel family protein [Bacteroidales bacterium]MDD6002988.1 MotA/TolQ/ExbB proton channel family protein [Bacteroidales bacterium]